MSDELLGMHLSAAMDRPCRKCLLVCIACVDLKSFGPGSKKMIADLLVYCGITACVMCTPEIAVKARVCMTP